MKIKEEIRTFTNDAHELALKMIVVADEINLGTVTASEGADKLDTLARDMKSLADCIKDLAYQLKKSGAARYRVEWLHNGNWRMEENDGLVFVKKEEAYVAAENEKVKAPGLVTRVVEVR